MAKQKRGSFVEIRPEKMTFSTRIRNAKGRFAKFRSGQKLTYEVQVAVTKGGVVTRGPLFVGSGANRKKLIIKKKLKKPLNPTTLASTIRKEFTQKARVKKKVQVDKDGQVIIGYRIVGGTGSKPKKKRKKAARKK